MTGLIIAIVMPVVYAILINADALDNPPAWDSATTVSPAALTIVDRNFNIWEVAQLPSSLEGGPSIHATSIYTIALAALIWLVGPETAFYLAHVGSILLVGALSAATYLLARERASVHVSAFAAATVSIVPLVVQQAADIYIDLPLAVVTTLACWAASRRRFWLTAVLVLLGVAIKTAGVFLIPLILFARPSHKKLSRHVAHTAAASVIALVPFLLAFATSDRVAVGAETWALGLVDSSAFALFLTIDLFVVMAAYSIAIYVQARSTNTDRPIRAGALIVVGFFAAYGGTMMLTGTIMILPRYYIAILPAMIVALTPPADPSGRLRFARAARFGLIGGLALFSLINVNGDFYYSRNHDFYVMAERSTRAQDLLELQMLGTRELVATGLPLVVGGYVHFRLAYPDMGYVDETPKDVITTFRFPVELPDRFAMLIERRTRNPLILIEDWAIDNGYNVIHRDIRYRGFQSQLVIASR